MRKLSPQKAGVRRPRSRSPGAALPRRGQGTTAVSRLPRPLMGHRESTMRVLRPARRLRRYQRLEGPIPGPNTSRWRPADPGSKLLAASPPAREPRVGIRRKRGTGCGGPGGGRRRRGPAGVCGAAGAWPRRQPREDRLTLRAN